MKEIITITVYAFLRTRQALQVVFSKENVEIILVFEQRWDVGKISAYGKELLNKYVKPDL